MTDCIDKEVAAHLSTLTEEERVAYEQAVAKFRQGETYQNRCRNEFDCRALTHRYGMYCVELYNRKYNERIRKYGTDKRKGNGETSIIP